MSCNKITIKLSKTQFLFFAFGIKWWKFPHLRGFMWWMMKTEASLTSRRLAFVSCADQWPTFNSLFLLNSFSFTVDFCSHSDDYVGACKLWSGTTHWQVRSCWVSQEHAHLVSICMNAVIFIMYITSLVSYVSRRLVVESPNFLGLLRCLVGSFDSCSGVSGPREVLTYVGT